MAIKIPVYERQVGFDTQKAVNPADYFRAPVRGAFGEGVAQSMQGLGDTVANIAGTELRNIQYKKEQERLFKEKEKQKEELEIQAEKDRKLKEFKANSAKIGKMLEKRQEERYKQSIAAQKASIITNHELEINDLLYSNEDEEIEINGESVSRKRGVMNRPLKSSSGVTREFTENYHRISQEKLSQIEDENLRNEMSINFLQKFPNLQKSVSLYEIDQEKKDKVNTHSSAIDISSRNANIADIESVDLYVKYALESQNAINEINNYDPLTRREMNSEVVSRVVLSAASGAVLRDVSGKEANSIVDKYKNVLSEEQYSGIKENIKKLSAKREKEILEQRKVEVLNNEVDLINSFLSGGSGVLDVSDITNKILDGRIRNDFGKSIINAILHPDIEAYADNDIATVAMLDSIFRSDDKEAMNNSIKNILDGFTKNELGGEQMRLLVQTAMAIGDERNVEVIEKKKSAYNRLNDYVRKKFVPRGIDILSMAHPITYFLWLLNNTNDEPDVIADKVIDSMIKSQDPSYEGSDKVPVSKVELFNEGETFLNPSTGKRIRVVNGQWIEIK